MKVNLKKIKEYEQIIDIKCTPFSKENNLFSFEGKTKYFTPSQLEKVI
jgi:hypothetical protein